MGEDHHSRFKHYRTFARTFLAACGVFLLGTIIPAFFSLETFQNMCICKVNYLAYAWIAFAITLLISSVSLVLATAAETKECCAKKTVLHIVLLWLQAIGLIAGIVLLLVFITKFVNVL
jgi:heme exporter protein D